MSILTKIMGKKDTEDGVASKESSGAPSQGAMNLIMDQIKDLIEINTSLNKKFRDLDAKVNSMSSDVGTDKNSMNEMQKKISDVQTNMEKFIGLYEVITNQFNPFVDTGDETDEYEIDADGNPVPVRRPVYSAQHPQAAPVMGQPMVAGAPQQQMPVQAAPVFDNNSDALSEEEMGKLEEGQEEQQDASVAQEEQNDVAEPGLESADGAGVGEQENNAVTTDGADSDFANYGSQDKSEYDSSNDGMGVQTSPQKVSSSRSIDSFGPNDYYSIDVDSIVPLTSVKGNVGSITTILSWMVYLIKQCGEGAGDVLNYYTTIGWIHPHVTQILMHYLDGLNVRPDEKSDGRMDVSDHIVSLFFIAKIKGSNLNAKTYRLISRIVKSKGFIIDE